jgi:hypothetical protein
MASHLEIVPVEWSPEARERLQEAMRRGDTTGGLRTIEDVCAGGHVFELHADEGVVGTYVLREFQRPLGREGVVIAGAGGMAGHWLAKPALLAIEQQFAGVDAISLETRRLGLVRQLVRLGYGIEGFRMRKHLKKGPAC